MSNDDLMDPKDQQEIQDAIQREIDSLFWRNVMGRACPRCGMERDITESESGYLWKTHTEDECELARILES